MLKALTIVFSVEERPSSPLPLRTARRENVCNLPALVFQTGKEWVEGGLGVDPYFVYARKSLLYVTVLCTKLLVSVCARGRSLPERVCPSLCVS